MRLALFFTFLFLPLTHLHAETPATVSLRNVHRRADFSNARHRFETEKKGHVAFLGGSITEMEGYRPMVMADLQARFPETEFTFTNAGISSTCSTTGSFRLERDVLSKGPVDLLFVEFAVNDDQDAAHAHRECVRGMEGVLRRARTYNPKVDLVVTYFVNPKMREMLSDGKTPISIAAHESVARHYDVSTVNLAKEVAQQIDAGDLTWQRFGGTHPKPPGNRIAADMIKAMFDAACEKPAEPGAYKTPEKLVDSESYVAGEFLSPEKTEFDSPWKYYEPDWKKIGGGFRDRFGGAPLLCCEEPGASMTVTFTGRALGAFILAGPDAGQLEVKIDDEPAKTVELFHHYSRGLHYPRTVILAADLTPTKHTATITLGKQHHSTSKGTSARIMEFTVNK